MAKATVEITGRHVSVSDSMRDYALKKVESAISEFTKLENVHVILDVQKYLQIAEIVVQGRDRLRLEVRDTSEDMYASIDLVTNKLEQRLLKLKDKKTEKRIRTGQHDRL